MHNENVFVEVINPLAMKFGIGGMSIFAIANFVGASQRDVLGYFSEGAIPAISV
jgi:hypothetical protein